MFPMFGFPAVNCIVPALSNFATWSDATTNMFSSSCSVDFVGNIVCPFDSPAVVQKCSEGYNYASGDVERHCQDDGSWSGSPMTCQRKFEKVIVTPKM